MWLAGDVGDEFKISVVKDGEVEGFRAGGGEGVEEGEGTTLTADSARGLQLEGPGAVGVSGACRRERLQSFGEFLIVGRVRGGISELEATGMHSAT